MSSFHIAKKSIPAPVTEAEFQNGIDNWEEKQLINPEVPNPSKESFEKWKAFISSVYNHPNLLVHPDVHCIRELFGVLGTEIRFENANLMIELGKIRNKEKTHHHLKPPTSFEDIPLNLVFAHINEIHMIPHLDVAIVQSYGVMEDFKTALTELIDLVWKYPEILLYPDFTFFYDFLIKFGVSSEVITYEIYQTQLRRLQCKIPSSSLLLKQGEPELKTEKEDQDESTNAHAVSRDGSEVESMESSQSRRSSRLSSRYSGTDSGFSSMDQNESSSEDEGSDEDLIEESDEDCLEEEDESNIIFDDGVPQGRGKRRLRKPDTVMRRPFKCTVCSNRYAFKSNCNRHITQNHPGARLHPVRQTTFKDPGFVPPYFCSVCNKGFSTKDSCKTHIRKFHLKIKGATPIANPLATVIEKKKVPKHSQSKLVLCNNLDTPRKDDRITSSHEHVSNDEDFKSLNNIGLQMDESYSGLKNTQSSEVSLFVSLFSPLGDLNCNILMEKDF